MPQLIPCPGCAQLVRSDACVCMFCGEEKVCQRRALPAAALLLGLAAATPGCDLKDIQSDYAAPITETGETGERDRDGDGYQVSDGDCDDDDATVYPGAPETAGDGVDSNCDDADDT